MIALVFAIIWITYRFIKAIVKKTKFDKKFFKKELLYILFWAYILFVIGLTLLPIKIKISDGVSPDHIFKPTLNLNPLNGINLTNMIGFKNIIGNLVLLSPLAVFLPIIGYKKFAEIKPLFILALTVSFTIELLQYLEGYFNLAASFRISDIMDIILNVAGIFIGNYIYNNLFKTDSKKDLIHEI
ncbi:VanZ family protein [Clostridium hydrogeniformans]|uniref:VanZ family protein n=1 Tax=Clostridium hydrogeniformans TaxID=349933 RepID=UPI00047FF516|nr:VanZ family protein [Clostridium hydrogeniformans]